LSRDILRIIPTEIERVAGTLGMETIGHASRRFRIDGALIIESIVSTAVVAEARDAFVEAYSHYLSGAKHEDALPVGKRRLSITVKLEPPFDNRELFANPYLLPILTALLDDGFVLGAFGVVCSLSSAPAQPAHCDGGVLFPNAPLNTLLPAVAITVGIPLLEMNELHGTTGLWLGTHRDATRSNTLRDAGQNNTFPEEGIEPVVREGSCILWDFRLVHGGTANRGPVPRPLLYMTYCRPWFVDHGNFNTKANPKQKPVVAKRKFLESLSEPHQRLLVRAREA
jgi:ectoine hydroxylase-related dioxygenase (phytanoyl-CoA dioxygenase family)